MTLGRWITRDVRGVRQASAGAVPAKAGRCNGVGRQEVMPEAGAGAAERRQRKALRQNAFEPIA